MERSTVGYIRSSLLLIIHLSWRIFPRLELPTYSLHSHSIYTCSISCYYYALGRSQMYISSNDLPRAYLRQADHGPDTASITSATNETICQLSTSPSSLAGGLRGSLVDIMPMPCSTIPCRHVGLQDTTSLLLAY